MEETKDTQVFKLWVSFVSFVSCQARSDKPGKIPSNLESILKSMKIETENWFETVVQFDNWFYRIAGRVRKFIETARKTGHKWLAGKTASTKANSKEKKGVLAEVRSKIDGLPVNSQRNAIIKPENTLNSMR